MPNPHSAPALGRAVTAAAAALVAGLLLAGCSPTEGGPSASDRPRESSSPTAPGTPEPSGSPTPSTTATTTPTATPTAGSGTPVSIACDALVPAQALYDFNPNFSADPSYQPAADTLPATIAADRGVACGYVNQTSGEVIEVAVGHPQAAELQKAKDALAAQATPVPTYGGDAGYFGVESGSGQAQAFVGEYRVVARSTTFEEPGDHASLVAAIVTTVSAQRP